MNGADAAIEGCRGIRPEKCAVIIPGGVECPSEYDNTSGDSTLLERDGYRLRVTSCDPGVVEYQNSPDGGGWEINLPMLRG